MNAPLPGFVCVVAVPPRSHMAKVKMSDFLGGEKRRERGRMFSEQLREHADVIRVWLMAQAKCPWQEVGRPLAPNGGKFSKGMCFKGIGKIWEREGCAVPGAGDLGATSPPRLEGAGGGEHRLYPGKGSCRWRLPDG